MTRTAQPTNTPRAPTTTEERPPSETAEKYLHNKLERAVLMAIRHATGGAKNGISDGELDWLFGRKQAAARENVLQQLLGLKLVRCEKAPGGGRKWQAVYQRKNTADDPKATSNANGKEEIKNG